MICPGCRVDEVPSCAPPDPASVEAELTCGPCSPSSSAAEPATWTRISGRTTRVRGAFPYSNAISKKNVPGITVGPALTVISRVSEKRVIARDWEWVAASPPSGTNRTFRASTPVTSAPNVFSTAMGNAASSPTSTA